TIDNEKCLKLVRELMKVSSMFGYGEVNESNRSSTLMNTYSKIDDPKFRYSIIKKKQEVYDALKSIFKKQEVDL
ncbi:MAG: DUF444 family protein, partial [Solibacillus sp.]